MQKIMFNDRFGLTQAVIDGRKTMTRRIVPNVPCFAYNENGIKKHGGIEDMEIRCYDTLMIKFRGDWHTGPKECQPKYKIVEVVAVAQSYYEIYEEIKRTHGSSSSVTREFFHRYIQGGRMPVSNKMFVRSEAMLNQIKITNIKIEKLQDISDEDCLKEGIRYCGESHESSPSFPTLGFDDFERKVFCNYATPRQAFAALIDKISGKGTWDRNPWVFVYEFQLIK